MRYAICQPQVISLRSSQFLLSSTDQNTQANIGPHPFSYVSRWTLFAYFKTDRRSRSYAIKVRRAFQTTLTHKLTVHKRLYNDAYAPGYTRNKLNTQASPGEQVFVFKQEFSQDDAK